MFRKPNDNYDYNTSEKNVKNQIGRRFDKIFDILMNSDYYEGTKYANYFNRINEDGTSKIYVYDPLEKKLDKVMQSEKNEIKYLVGLAGMGKTTLLRNYFKIIDRDIKLDENNIIIYISFYYSNLSSDNPQKSVDDEIRRYFLRAVRALISKNSELFDNEERFWTGLYDFILDNKPTLLENENFTPESFILRDLLSNDISYDSKKKKIDNLCIYKPIEYYSILIKYILKALKKSFNITFIYDDIEAKEEIFHKKLIETARHIHSCFCANKESELVVKTFVSLRAYTFRCNIGRMSDARREHLQKDTILKSSSVKLHDIFEKRFKEIEEIEKTKENSNKAKTYDDARRQLFYVEEHLNSIGSELIYNLANNNLCDAMIIYCSVMTNLEWIACNEEEYNGAFKIDADNYRLTTENIMYAIANGNSLEYMDKENSYVPNILTNKFEDEELINIYIIRYMINNGITLIYGDEYREGKAILSDIVGLFVKNNNNDVMVNYWHDKVNHSLKHLYRAGILLRSLHDIEETEEKQLERIYSDSYKLYLSPRGQSLYKLFSKNAVLLELYRDDIYTDLPNNDKLTSRMSTDLIFEYLLNYLNLYFKLEKKYIGSAIPDLEKYQVLIGTEFITSVFLEGVSKNINTYYKNQGPEYDCLMAKVFELRDNMLDYSKALQEEYNIGFSISNYLNR